MAGNTSPRPGTILVPVATELLGDMEAWSPPVEARAEEIGGQWEITFRHSTVLADLRRQVQELAHQLDHLDHDDRGELDAIRRALHQLARGGG